MSTLVTDRPMDCCVVRSVWHSVLLAMRGRVGEGGKMRGGGQAATGASTGKIRGQEQLVTAARTLSGLSTRAVLSSAAGVCVMSLARRPFCET